MHWTHRQYLRNEQRGRCDIEQAQNEKTQETKGNAARTAAEKAFDDDGQQGEWRHNYAVNDEERTENLDSELELTGWYKYSERTHFASDWRNLWTWQKQIKSMVT